MKTAVLTFTSVFMIVSISMMVSGEPGNTAIAREANSGRATTENAGEAKHDFVAVGHPTFVSPHANPIAISGDRVFVVNTPADTVDVIDIATQKLVYRIPVGVDPVSIAVRPDGLEVWVSNHVSDSVSVIDNDRTSPTWLNVIATIQEFDSKRATTFDEPVGIAFAGNDKAYVALSSENQIAVVDVASRKITKRLNIPAQDPRAIKVHDGKLYVIPFESNNKTQLSGGNKDKIDGDLVTFDAWEHSIVHNNVLSLGHVVDIVKHPDVPDRDLFVFDTETDRLIETVDSLGTLLYGLTVDSNGRVFIAQTDARNDINGRAGTKKHGLTQLQNRAFLNRITSVRPGGDQASDNRIEFFDLEPLPPEQPEANMALATPFAIEISTDDSTLVVSAAASDTMFTIDSATGKVLGRTKVGAVPRGIALTDTGEGKLSQAWILNAVANTVSLVDVSNTADPRLIDSISLEDPTHPAVKRGRMAFETAAASTTGTYSCASCHPDGHTDQLLWVLKTPIVTGGNQIMPRSTMPIRGLRDTEPYHWDGIPGDPYGGNNSANVHGSDPPNSRIDPPTSAARHLIDGGIAGTMSLVGDQTLNDEGKAGRLNSSQRDDMATFLLSVPYPPAQRRPYTNVVSRRAEEGFKLFHIDGDLDPTKSKPNVCGDCHRMPFLVSTNTPGTGMDAPTWRGAYDRFLILPQGRLNIIDFDFYARVAERGQPERDIWQFSWAGRRRFDPVWEMVLEGSTGFSGSFARQVTLNQTTANEEQTRDLLNALELSASEGAVVLEADGVFPNDQYKLEAQASEPTALAAGVSNRRQHHTLQYHASSNSGHYVQTDNGKSFTRQQLIEKATAGEFVGTFTARHGDKADFDDPQPAIWTPGPIEQQSGSQDFPVLYSGNGHMTVSGRHIDEEARVFIDGRRVTGDVQVAKDEEIKIDLKALPSVGMHLLQLQNPDGLFSNDFIFHVTADQASAAEFRQSLENAQLDKREALAAAVTKGDIGGITRVLASGAGINDRNPKGGSTPLSTAALYGQLEAARFLLERGAKVDATNEDGNTPLLVAAFFCRTEVVQLLLEKGGSPTQKNKRGETPIDVVSGAWDQPLAGIYSGIGNAVGIKLDLEFIERQRPLVAAVLRESRK